MVWARFDYGVYSIVRGKGRVDCLEMVYKSVVIRILGKEFPVMC